MKSVTYAPHGGRCLAVSADGAVMDLRDAGPATPSDITAAPRTGGELPPGAAGPRPQAVLDGTATQGADAACTIFPVAATAALPGGCMTLEPGGVIAAGIPARAGFFRNPQMFVKASNRMEILIETTSTPRNAVANEAAGRWKQARAQGMVRPAA